MGEILGLKLNADWVVLSACNTAAADGAGAEAVSGLGRAFFYAGARALLVSNWPVETTSAKALTTNLFKRQAKDPALTRPSPAASHAPTHRRPRAHRCPRQDLILLCPPHLLGTVYVSGGWGLIEKTSA